MSLLLPQMSTPKSVATGIAIAMLTMSNCSRTTQPSQHHASQKSPAAHQKEQGTHDTVVLLPASPGHVAAACYSVTQGVLGGEPCLELMPASANAQISTGERIRAGAQVPIHYCDSAESDPPAQRGLDLGQTQGVVVWPELDAVDFQLVPGSQPEPSNKELAAATAIVREQVPSLKDNTIRLEQSVRLDVDGDGELEWFFSAVVSGDRPSDPQLAFSGLFLYRSDTTQTARLLFRSEYTVARILASLDLDQDGHQELLIAKRYYEGDSLEVVSVSEKGLTIIGSWGCGS